MLHLFLIDGALSVLCHVFHSVKIWMRTLCCCCLGTSLCANDFALTPSQVVYLKNKNVIHYCVDPDWMPFEAIRQEQHIGISSDYFKLFTERSAIPFKLYLTASWDESLQALQQKKCDLVSLINHTQERSEYLFFTDVVLRDPNVIVTQDHVPYIGSYDGLGGLRLGVVKGYMQEEYIRRHFPDVKLKLLDSELQGLELVSQGLLDATTGSMLSITNHIREKGLSNLKISGQSRRDDELRVAVIKSEPELHSIMSNLVASIPEEDHIRIFKKWNTIKYVSEVDYSYVWKLSLFFLLTIAILLERYLAVRRFNFKLTQKNMELKLLHVQLEEQNQQLSFLSAHDELTHLANRKSINEKVLNEVRRARRYNTPLSMLLIDVDKFKLVNDQYGHATGDKILVEVSSLLKSSIRDTDFIGRWGGEEFLVLCPETTEHKAEELAVRILNGLKTSDFSCGLTITCSIGVTQLNIGETYDGWFERTDKALYGVKNSGGDGFRLGS